MITEITTKEIMNPIKASFKKSGVLVISDNAAIIFISKDEIKELRDFLNQLELE